MPGTPDSVLSAGWRRVDRSRYALVVTSPLWRGPALVVCDLVGTTVQDDGQVPAAFAVALRQHGLGITPEQLQAQRAAAVYATFHDALAAQLARTDGVRAMPGAAAVFAWLRGQGVRVALNTGFDRGITDALLAALGWDQAVVDAVVCVDDVAQGRPAPDLIQCAMRRTGVLDPGAVANVGDTTLDLHAAHAAGVRWNLGVCSGAHPRALLAQAPHTQLLDSVADLRALW